jgi:hypothetical protein
MKTYLKAFLAGVATLAVATSASAQVRIGVYAGDPQPYYPPAVRVVPQYVAPSGYDREPDAYVVPDWRARQEWREMREREWRHAEWRRREEWRRDHERRLHEEWHREHAREYYSQPYDRD